MKLAVFIGFSDTKMWNALPVPVKNKVKLLGFSYTRLPTNCSFY